MDRLWCSHGKPGRLGFEGLTRGTLAEGQPSEETVQEGLSHPASQAPPCDWSDFRWTR